jgi:hypothetical protein
VSVGGTGDCHRVTEPRAAVPSVTTTAFTQSLLLFHIADAVDLVLLNR